MPFNIFGQNGKKTVTHFHVCSSRLGKSVHNNKVKSGVRAASVEKFGGKYKNHKDNELSCRSDHLFSKSRPVENGGGCEGKW